MSTPKKNTSYAEDYRGIDSRSEPHLYKVGTGERGVLIAEPTKSEILPHWRFKTEEMAREASEGIYAIFFSYRERDDSVSMDMARTFLRMGYTRARRYANHRSGKKYDDEGKVRPQEPDARDGEKARAARVPPLLREVEVRRGPPRRILQATQKGMDRTVRLSPALAWPPRPSCLRTETYRIGAPIAW